MTITIIGAGNVATHLGFALQKAGHEIVYVFSRTLHSAKGLAEKIGSKAVCDISALKEDTDVYLYSVSDSALPYLVERIAPQHDASLHVHTAGCVDIDVFKGFARRFGVIYPLQSFSKTRNIDVSVVPFFVEGSDENTISDIHKLTSSISNCIADASSEKRRKLHLSAVFACNFVNHCYSLSAKILKKENLSFDLLRPLIRETYEKIEQLHPLDAQTGPAVRCDMDVMNRHICMLDDEIDKQIYRLMSQSINKEHHDKL